MTKLVIVSGEESANFTLVKDDGTEHHIVNLNHDDHGWHAMETAGNALEKLATELGATIEHRSEYDEDNGMDEFGS